MQQTKRKDLALPVYWPGWPLGKVDVNWLLKLCLLTWTKLQLLSHFHPNSNDPLLGHSYLKCLFLLLFNCNFGQDNCQLSPGRWLYKKIHSHCGLRKRQLFLSLSFSHKRQTWHIVRVGRFFFRLSNPASGQPCLFFSIFLSLSSSSEAANSFHLTLKSGSQGFLDTWHHWITWMNYCQHENYFLCESLISFDPPRHNFLKGERGGLILWLNFLAVFHSSPTDWLECKVIYWIDSICLL